MKTSIIKRTLSLFMALILCLSALPLANPVLAASTWPTLSASAYCEFTATKTIYCYRNSACTTRGTSSPAKSYNSYIAPNDVCRIIGITSSYLIVQFPTSSGYRTAYIKRSDVFGVSVPTEKVTSQGKVTVYKNTSGTTYGSTAKGDAVFACGTSGNYTFIIYTAKSGNRAYKLGWVKTSDYNSVIKASKATNQSKSTVENGVKYTYVTVTLDVSNLSNWMSSYLRAQNKLDGMIVAQTVNERRKMQIVEPLQGPAYNGKSPTRTTTINAPYRVTFKIHSHERKMGFGSSWRYANQSLVVEYNCACGYHNTLCVWEIPIPDPSEFAKREIINTIKAQSSQYYWINNVK